MCTLETGNGYWQFEAKQDGVWLSVLDKADGNKVICEFQPLDWTDFLRCVLALLRRVEEQGQDLHDVLRVEYGTLVVKPLSG